MPGQALVVRRIAESEMFYKNNIEYFIFPIFSETFYYSLTAASTPVFN